MGQIRHHRSPDMLTKYNATVVFQATLSWHKKKVDFHFIWDLVWNGSHLIRRHQPLGDDDLLLLRGRLCHDLLLDLVPRIAPRRHHPAHPLHTVGQHRRPQHALDNLPPNITLGIFYLSNWDLRWSLWSVLPRLLVSASWSGDVGLKNLFWWKKSNYILKEILQCKHRKQSTGTKSIHEGWSATQIV